ncbi:MAG: NAD(P)-binding domain-containing protein, partial [Candidatus Thiodiazotropha sp.]
YRLIDPEQYQGQHVLVVGGGDSALEAATSIAANNASSVTLSYRSGSFSRAKRKNREKMEKAVESGKIRLMLNSNITSFTSDRVTISTQDEQIELPNDAAIICAGGVLPTGFLKETGIDMETKHGTT